MNLNQITQGDSLSVLRGWPDESIQCVITSPPYWGLRDYGVDGQLGLEKTPEEYVAKMTVVFREVRRVLRSDGTLWLNIGDSYAASATGSFNGGGFKDKSAMTGGRDMSGVETSGRLDKRKMSGLKPKDLVGIPWLVAFALRADGWYLRSDIIWSKPNPMPESVTDRPTKSHEYIFLMSKSAKYFYDAKAIAEPFADERMGNPNGGGRYAKEAFAYAGPNAQSGLQKGFWNVDGSRTTRNKRSVWAIPTNSFTDAHFATFPPDLVKVCLMAGSKVGDVICDPFMGSGTVAVVAKNAGRQYVGIELNPAYIEMAEKRLRQEVLSLSDIPLDTRIEEL